MGPSFHSFSDGHGNNLSTAGLVSESTPRERTMPKQPKKLDELFHDGLRDIYFAEKKILIALPKMAKAAESEDLANAFKEHEKQTKDAINNEPELPSNSSISFRQLGFGGSLRNM
jgi:hypothetical protein